MTIDKTVPDKLTDSEKKKKKQENKSKANPAKAAANKATVKEERVVAKVNAAKVAKAARKARRAQEIEESELTESSDSFDGELVSVRSTYARVNNIDSYYSCLIFYFHTSFVMHFVDAELLLFCPQ